MLSRHNSFNSQEDTGTAEWQSHQARHGVSSRSTSTPPSNFRPRHAQRDSLLSVPLSTREKLAFDKHHAQVREEIGFSVSSASPCGLGVHPNLALSLGRCPQGGTWGRTISTPDLDAVRWTPPSAPNAVREPGTSREFELWSEGFRRKEAVTSRADGNGATQRPYRGKGKGRAVPEINPWVDAPSARSALHSAEPLSPSAISPSTRRRLESTADVQRSGQPVFDRPRQEPSFEVVEDVASTDELSPVDPDNAKSGFTFDPTVLAFLSLADGDEDKSCKKPRIGDSDPGDTDAGSVSQSEVLLGDTLQSGLDTPVQASRSRIATGPNRTPIPSALLRDSVSAAQDTPADQMKLGTSGRAVTVLGTPTAAASSGPRLQRQYFSHKGIPTRRHLDQSISSRSPAASQVSSYRSRNSSQTSQSICASSAAPEGNGVESSATTIEENAGSSCSKG